MHVATIDFPIRGRLTAKVTDAALSLLSVWFKNGQIVGDDWPLVRLRGVLRAHVSIPARDSLKSKYSNQYVLQFVAELAAAGLGSPKVTVLGPDPGTPAPCSCRTRPFQIVYTHFLDTASPPLRCGACFDPVPLYLTPHTHDHEHLDVLQWAADYRSCGTLQMNCTVGELFGERQMGDVRSALSKTGRGLCRDIAAATGIPTYYFLAKGRGRSAPHERNRRCPSCAGSWLLPTPLHDLFDFKCDRCFLLSNIAYTVAWQVRDQRVPNAHTNSTGPASRSQRNRAT